MTERSNSPGESGKPTGVSAPELPRVVALRRAMEDRRIPMSRDLQIVAGVPANPGRGRERIEARQPRNQPQARVLTQEGEDGRQDETPPTKVSHFASSIAAARMK